MDWSPNPNDIPDIVGSSFTLTNNKISLASTTIELNGTTIAKAIQAESLDVGNGNFHVGTDGIISAKGVNISGTINATDGSFSGLLKGVSGSFKSLQAIDDNGVVKADMLQELPLSSIQKAWAVLIG